MLIQKMNKNQEIWLKSRDFQHNEHFEWSHCSCVYFKIALILFIGLRICERLN